MKYIKRIVVMMWVLAMVPVGSEADEIDRLVEEVKPPARFKDYKPKFAVKTVEVRGGEQPWRPLHNLLPKLYPEMKQPITLVTRLQMVMDGDRYIGHVYRSGYVFYCGSPVENKNDLLQFDNWIYQPSANVDFRLGPYVPDSYKRAALPKQIRVEGNTVYAPDDLVDVKVEGDRVIAEWNDEFVDDAKGSKFTARVKHRLVISVDPVLGYVVENTMAYETNDPARHLPAFKDGSQTQHEGRYDLDYGSFFPNGNLTLFEKYQKKWAYTWQFYTVAAAGDIASGKDKRFGVWRCNGICTDSIRHQRHCQVTGNGLTGYLKNPDGWGLALTRTENAQDHIVNVCPAYGEFYVHGPLPKEPDKDGFHRLTTTRRVTGLPPEICDFVLANGYNRFGDPNQKALQIRLPGEDFEEQPLPYTTPTNGVHYIWTGNPGVVSEKEAHSGKKSLCVKGATLDVVTKTWPSKERPPARFDPNTRYRVECWVKVVGADTQAWISLHMIANHCSPEMIKRGLCSEPIPAGDWRKVTFETTIPPEGLAVILAFICVGPGKAYFDDFKIEEQGRAPASAALTPTITPQPRP